MALVAVVPVAVEEAAVAVHSKKGKDDINANIDYFSFIGANWVLYGIGV